MTSDALFLTALQSGLFLGLIHGINPCGHSWLVLAPFTAGSRDPGRVLRLTSAFIGGTSLGCLLIGLILGGFSMSLPDGAQMWADLITAGVLIILGVILLIKPTLLHKHDHGHDHHHAHDDHGSHEHHIQESGCGCNKSKLVKSTATGLFTLGFLNMIVPCPTVAIMYSYALSSQSALLSMAVFGIYALGTAVALACVIWAIYRTTSALRALDKPWIEPLVMRVTGLLVLGFAVYSLWAIQSAAPIS